MYVAIFIIAFITIFLMVCIFTNDNDDNNKN